MAKYVNLPTAMYPGSTATNAAAADSGTTTGATEGKLTEAGQNFTTTVNVGDYAVITTGITGYPVRSYAKVNAVDSDTVLSISGPGVAASGTGGLSAIGTVYSIIAAADIYKCVLAASTFEADVQAGDMVCNTTTNKNYIITEVVDDTTLTIDTIGGIIVGDDFFILSDRGLNGNRKVLVSETTLIRGNAANGQLTLHYKRGATNQKLAIDMGDAVTDDAYAVEFKRLAQLALESPWPDVTIQMPIFSSTGTQLVQWAGTFTFS
tara:strand:- start:803 stop:1594 length:792 start_codon:yes stop_codon:yes gene_type:complete